MQLPVGENKPAFAWLDIRVLRERPLFVVAIYLMLGILSITVLPAWPFAGLVAVMALLLICLLLFACRVDISLPLVLAAFVAGYALASAALPAWAGDPWAPPGAGRLTGRIVEAGTTQSGYTSYVLDDARLDDEPISGRVYVTARAAGDGREGDSLSATVELERPEPSAYAGDFNARGYYLRRGIRFTAFAPSVEIMPEPHTDTIFDLPRRTRQYADDVLHRYLSPENAGLIDALLSGDKSGISAETREAFAALGVAHLLAVSGLNISLTAGAAWLLCRKLRLPMILSLAVSFAVMAAYVLFAGFTPSVERAAAMWLVMMGGVVAARQYDPLTSLSVAALLILAVNPLDLFDAGFQLSFLATAAIFLWVAPLQRWLPRKKWLDWTVVPVGVTVCVTLLALPVILQCFHFVSLLSPLANLALVPFSLMLQLTGTALLFVGFLPGPASLLGGVLDQLATWYLQLVAFLNGSAAVLPAAVPPLWLAAVYAALAAAVSPSLVRLRPKGRVAALAALAVAAALMFSSAVAPPQPDAVVLSETDASLSLCWRQDGGQYAACGEHWRETAGYLESRGVVRLDGLYVLRRTPPKNGDMLLDGGRVRVGRLYVPDAWLKDPEAAAFLTQARSLGMEPLPAGLGPAVLLGEEKRFAALLLPNGLAYVPWAAAGSVATVASTVGSPSITVLGMTEGRAGELPDLIPGSVLVLPGGIAGRPSGVYNSTECGSIGIQSGGAVALTPWRGEWADGLQGSFR